MTASAMSSNTLLTLLFLSASSTPSTAFVPFLGPTSPRLQPLHATETFQRSLLEAQLKLSDKSKSSPVDNVVATTTSSESEATSSTPVVSVDYDAAARLAYEAAGSVGEFTDFRANYLEETSAMMAKKNPYVKTAPVAPVAEVPEPMVATPIVSVDYDAAARLAYVAAGETGEFETFKMKYLEETSAMIATKNPYVSAVVEKVPVEPIIETPPSPPEEAFTAPPTQPEPILLTPTPTPAPAPLPKTEFTIPRELAIVPINEATVQFTAGLLGATAGFLLGGPILSAILAATTNYLSRKEDDTSSSVRNGNEATTVATSPKKIVDTASQTALLLYNYLARFEKENNVVDTTFRLMEGAVDKLKTMDSPASSTIVQLETTLGDIAKKVEEWNDDYDFVNGAGTVLNSVGDLVEVSVDKVVELNEEYRLTERVGEVVRETVKKVTEERRD
ncbi:hypothetical protein HJC23_004442 [Cyclotella cryptica]|uniref:Plastid lipid-associated protein/fibrillin conserved domain-containing protein n=1 Tax=Cyclotella cryptica TaxID=29204 RepID=A0ABD3QFV5_9STRA|eukprot:CCRYP_006068-RB/>CCRYP_006068-RB protein AED:0.06 eAED:0.06 QI:185/-1/1/1/-1/1/1/331/446